jgi:hypothetical protein
VNSLCFRIGGLSLLFRSRDLHFRDAAAYRSFLGSDGEAPDLVADFELLSDTGSNGRARKGEPLLAAAREYLEETMPPLPDRTGTIQRQTEVVSRFLSLPSFRGCLQAFEPRLGEWRSLAVGMSNACFVDAECSRARIFLDRRAAHTLFPIIDGYVFSLLTLLLATRRGVILHAAGVVNGEDGYVFAGPSGAGKTTIARAAQSLGWPVLADDELVVRQGPDGTFRAFKTPWHMAAAPWGGSFGEQPESAPVRAIFFVEHGARDRRKRLNTMASTVSLVDSLFPTLRRLGTGHADSVLVLLTRLAGGIPCYRLSFTRSCGFLREIKSQYEEKKNEARRII